MFHHRGITGIGRKKTDCIIAPVIIQALSVYHSGAFHLIKLKNRHQLDCIHSQILQIRDLLAQSLISAFCPRCNTRWCIFCKSPHMHLINNKILKRMLRRTDISPVKVVFHNPCVINKIRSAFRALSPVTLSRYCPRIRIKQNIFFLK